MSNQTINKVNGVIKKFVVKKHIVNNKLLLAVCDEELFGKKFEQGDLVLDLTSNFYNGDLLNEKQTLVLMKQSYILNLVGNNSVNLALENGLIDEELVFFIENIPYAQSVRDDLK